MANGNGQNQNSNSGAAKSQEELAFANLKNKVVASLEVKPGTSHLLLVKRGSLTKMERDVFISLWARNFPKTGLLIFEVDNPEADVIALEVKKP